MFRHSNTIAVCDSEVWKFIQAESDRQEQLHPYRLQE